METNGCKVGKIRSEPFVVNGSKQSKSLWRSFILLLLECIPTTVPHLTHPHAAIHTETVKANCFGAAAVWTIPEKDISELLGAFNRQLQYVRQAAVIKMTSAPWKLCMVPFPQGKSQAYFQLYFTPDNSVWILVSQLRPELCSTEEQKRVPSFYRKMITKLKTVTTGKNSRPSFWSVVVIMKHQPLLLNRKLKKRKK